MKFLPSVKFIYYKSQQAESTHSLLLVNDEIVAEHNPGEESPRRDSKRESNEMSVLAESFADALQVPLEIFSLFDTDICEFYGDAYVADLSAEKLRTVAMEMSEPHKAGLFEEFNSQSEAKAMGWKDIKVGDIYQPDKEPAIAFGNSEKSAKGSLTEEEQDLLAALDELDEEEFYDLIKTHNSSLTSYICETGIQAMVDDNPEDFLSTWFHIGTLSHFLSKHPYVGAYECEILDDEDEDGWMEENAATSVYDLTFAYVNQVVSSYEAKAKITFDGRRLQQMGRNRGLVLTDEDYQTLYEALTTLEVGYIDGLSGLTNRILEDQAVNPCAWTKKTIKGKIFEYIESKSRSLDILLGSILDHEIEPQHQSKGKETTPKAAMEAGASPFDFEPNQLRSLGENPYPQNGAIYDVYDGDNPEEVGEYPEEEEVGEYSETIVGQIPY